MFFHLICYYSDDDDDDNVEEKGLYGCQVLNENCIEMLVVMQ